jgi:tRNA pseudouridine55 synthase
MTNSPPNNLPETNCNGWIVLDKPVGISSAKAVAFVRKAFKGIKTGHAGTLDPLPAVCCLSLLGKQQKLSLML